MTPTPRHTTATTRPHSCAIWLTTLTLLVAGCSSSGEDARKGSTRAAGADTSEVIARVGDRAITSDEFEAYLELKNVQKRDPERMASMLGELTRREALAQAITSSPGFDARALAVEVDEFRRQAATARYFDERLRAAATRDAVARHYEANPDAWSTRRAHVAHILARVPRNAPEAEVARKRELVDAALARLAAGEEFASVAAEVSEDRATASKGGDMGWVRKGAVGPEFSDAAFALKPGAHSGVVRSPFGFHVIKALSAPSTQRRPLEAVEGEIQQDLRARARKAEVDRLLGTVDVEIVEDWGVGGGARNDGASGADAGGRTNAGGAR